MGLFDFFEDAFEIVKATGELVTGLGEVLVEGTAELGEIMTDGFNEMVIKGNLEYKTSYELRDEAEKIISAAEGRYKRKYDSINSEIKDLKERIERLSRLKFELIQEIGRRNNSSSEIVSNIKIRFNNYGAPDFHGKYIFNISTFMGVGGNFIRKNTAQEYLEDSKDYKVEVDKKIVVLDRVVAKIEEAKFYLIEEKELLNVLQKAIHNQERLNYHSSAVNLKKLLEEQLISQSGTINSNYITAIRELEQICSRV